MMTEKIYNAITEAKNVVYNGWNYDEFNPQDFRSVMDFVSDHSKDPLLMEAIKAVLSASNWEDDNCNGIVFFLPRTVDIYDYLERNSYKIDVQISIYSAGYYENNSGDGYDIIEYERTVSSEYPHGSKWEVID